MPPEMDTRVQVPRQAKRGEIFEIRIAIRHPMETGFRFDLMGKAVAKNVIHTLTVRYNEVEIFRAEMGSGIAANPYLQLCAVADASGEIVCEWIDDDGNRGSQRAAISVAG